MIRHCAYCKQDFETRAAYFLHYEDCKKKNAAKVEKPKKKSGKAKAEKEDKAE